MKPTTHILFLALLLCSLMSYSQIEVKNKVVDFSTMLPIESVNIYIKNTTIGTITNSDGKFVLIVPQKHENDTLVFSSIGYKSFKTTVAEFDTTFDVILEEDVAALDEVLLTAEKTRPKTGNEIVLRALERLQQNTPDSSYVLKGFLRHKERNKKEFKWLIESAITVYDSSFNSNPVEHLKINVDQVRKSYDLRDVDSLLTYASYLKNNIRGFSIKAKNLKRDTIKTQSLVKAIKWNDERINGLDNLFKGKLNLLRNVNASKALFGEEILKNHSFSLDTVLVDNDRKIYKIKISNGLDYVGLSTEGIYNEGFHSRGWIYIYWDNYAIKQIEYELVAASKIQKSRSKTLFGTETNHKLIISYTDIDGLMYPKYLYYETPKLVNVGLKDVTKDNIEDKDRYNREERFYYTIQEVLFPEIILDQQEVKLILESKDWNSDIFAPKPYDKSFWKNYNTLLESEEEDKLIKDLTRRSTLFKE